MGGRGSAGETGQRRRLSGGSACKRGGAYQRADALLAGSHASPQSSARTARGAGPMLVQADLRQFPAHSERHEKHAEHVVIEVAHAGCLRRRDAARPCEAAVPCISVICTTAARASGPARTATIVALCAGWYIYEIGALPEKSEFSNIFLTTNADLKKAVRLSQPAWRSRPDRKKPTVISLLSSPSIVPHFHTP